VLETEVTVPANCFLAMAMKFINGILKPSDESIINCTTDHHASFVRSAKVKLREKEVKQISGTLKNIN
jgi:hypothetical protein